jgi:hypothetical protein
MKQISEALTEFFLAGYTSFGRADLISIALPNGMVLNVLDGTNTDITYSNTTYYTSQYGAWERGAFTNKAEFTPSSEPMELTAYIPETVYYPGTTTPLMQVVNAGMLNGAQVSIQTLFWPPLSPPSAGFSMGTMQLTKGQIGNVENTGRSKIVCKVFDYLYILNRPFPPHQIQSACRHSLFDAGCTLSVGSYISSAIVLDNSSSTLYLNLCSDSFIPNLPYPLGYVTFVTGQNSGLSGSIKAISPLPWLSTTSYVTGNSVISGGLSYLCTANNINEPPPNASYWTTTGAPLIQFQLLKPMPFAVSGGSGPGCVGGDEIKIIPGCDKTTTTCVNVYDNIIHFGGQPFVPNPETAQIIIFALGLGLTCFGLLKHFI